MIKRLKVVPVGRVKGKKITFAPTERVEGFTRIADDLMNRIFDLQTGNYVISDESHVLDFVPFDESDTSDLWRRITEIYGVHSADVSSGSLVEIFAAIENRRKLQ